MLNADQIEQREGDNEPPANTPTNTPSPADRIAAWRWPKGFCPNPSGRPKRDKAAEICREAIEQNPELVYKGIVRLLAKGSAYALKEVSDRAYGKVAERVELTGADGGPVQYSQSNLASLSAEELKTLESIAAKLAAAGRDQGGDPTPSAEQDQ